MRLKGRFFVAAVVWFVLNVSGAWAVAGAPARTGTRPAGTATPPNIVFILVDDLRADDIGCAGHPFVKTPHIDRIAREGVLLNNAFTVAPLCSPSRASILTGLMPHAHGIIDNTDRSEQSHRLVTFPLLLHRAGYETAFLGKWHMGNDDTARPGFDEWLCMKGQGSTNDPVLNHNGKRTRVHGYVTDLLTDRAVEFVRKQRSKPFLLFLAHKALHPELTQYDDGSISDPMASEFIPAKRHRNLYADEPVPRRPNVRDSLDDKPALSRRIDDLPPLGPNTGTSDKTIRDRLRMLMAVDEGLGRLLDALDETGRLDDTVIVLTSDHGYFYGEHGLSVERRLAYEENIRIPLLIRYPPLIRAGTRLDQLALNIDLAPTLLDLAGVPIPANLHGRSLVPLLKGEKTEPRRSFLIEYFSDTVFPRIRHMGYHAVRTKRWKYIHYTELTGMDELYDLQADPYEMNNRRNDPHAQRTLESLKGELQRLLKTTASVTAP